MTPLKLLKTVVVVPRPPCSSKRFVPSLTKRLLLESTATADGAVKPEVSMVVDCTRAPELESPIPATLATRRLLGSAT